MGYPFLQDMLNLCDEFVKSANDNLVKENILNSCDNKSTYEFLPTEYQKIACKKLIRNLYLCKGNKSEEYFTKRCSFLYIWLYFEKKQWDLSDNLIKKIFELKILKNDVNPNELCPYPKFDKDDIIDEKLIDLYVFDNNIETLVDISKRKIDSDDCTFKRFISNCIKIYKSICEEYDNNRLQNPTYNKDKCTKLETFKTNYSFLTDIKTVNGNIPTLDSKDFENFFTCSSVDIKQLDSSRTITTPAVIGILAGIFSLFGLTYKFTPVGKRFHSQYISGSIRNNLDIGENVTFLKKHNDSNIIASHDRYNVTYGTV
ncbi:VIR protein [Plasmodium vivax]|uniref:VIR protein n=1 Tax=Plasmodium vivax TaxID=5855 RepID=A0A1G4ED54_PLAVI|nr:VIR protein [Plasmodium vivax]